MKNFLTSVKLKFIDEKYTDVAFLSVFVGSKPVVPMVCPKRED
jgi:hypothetical protein